MRVELRELQQQLDIPSIIITHDPEDAVVLADEVYRIRRGSIEGSCSPTALQAESEQQLAQEEVA
jgi:molybdate transport system ATP-binding protein